MAYKEPTANTLSHTGTSSTTTADWKAALKNLSNNQIDGQLLNDNLDVSLDYKNGSNWLDVVLDDIPGDLYDTAFNINIKTTETNNTGSDRVCHIYLTNYKRTTSKYIIVTQKSSTSISTPIIYKVNSDALSVCIDNTRLIMGTTETNYLFDLENGWNNIWSKIYPSAGFYMQNSGSYIPLNGNFLSLIPTSYPLYYNNSTEHCIRYTASTIPGGGGITIYNNANDFVTDTNIYFQCVITLNDIYGTLTTSYFSNANIAITLDFPGWGCIGTYQSSVSSADNNLIVTTDSTYNKVVTILYNLGVLNKELRQQILNEMENDTETSSKLFTFNLSIRVY